MTIQDVYNAVLTFDQAVVKAKVQAELDAEAIQQLARAQDKAETDYIDVNASILGREPECLQWLVWTVQQVTDKLCAIDSTNPKAIEAAMSVH